MRRHRGKRRQPTRRKAPKGADSATFPQAFRGRTNISPAPSRRGRGFENYAKDIYDALQKGLVVANQGSPEDEFYTAQDNVITAFGKLIKYHGTHFPNLKEMISQWLQYLPITHDVGECPGMHGLLCDIIINSASVIFGDGNANVPKIIRVLCKIHGTQYSNEEIDKKAMQILTEFKNNPAFSASIAAAKEGAKKGILTKINKIFG